MARTGKFRWGILGCARIAIRRFIPAVQQLKSAEIVAIASRTLDKAREQAKAFGIPRAYGSYEELLADPDVEGVYIPLPNHLHCQWTIRAARQGKHILCEKPLAMDVPETTKMIAACRRRRVVLMEGFMYRFHPQWRVVRRAIDSGRIGEPRLVRATFSFVYAPAADNYRLHPEMGGGALFDVGCYCVNAARMIFGVEPIRAMAVQHLSDRLGADMTTCGVLEFPGSRIEVFDSSFEIEARWGLDIEGTKGRIVVPRPWQPGDEPAKIEVWSGAKHTTLTAPAANCYSLEAAHFAECARKGNALRWPPADAVANMRALMAIRKSAATGASVRL